MIAAILTALLMSSLGYGTRFEGYPLWGQIPAGLTIVPILINLYFGPTIYSYWKHKKSRYWICGNFVSMLCGGFPGLLLWIWAWCGKID
jgi:hypothetical protein